MPRRHVPPEERTWSIYVLEDPRTEGVVRYVGVTHGKPQQRLRDHIRGAERGVRYHSATWIRSLLRENVQPLMHVIHQGQGDTWASVETWWIAWHRAWGFNLTNHTDGGEGNVGITVSAETRAKQSAAKKGGKHSPEHIAKMRATMGTAEYKARHSALHKGHTKSPETLAKMSESMKARGKQTPEHVAKRAAANTGKIRSDEARAHMSKMNQGRVRSPEAIAKTVAANQGRKHTPETIALMSKLAQERAAQKRLEKASRESR